MRIVGGSLKGRKLTAPPGTAVRPTSDRAREALFNRLVHGAFSNDGTSSVSHAVVLDAFCGTGAMGLEALSRGAGHVHFLDNDPQSLDSARQNIATLGVQDHTTVLHADATLPPPARATCTLAFLDPPYREDMTAAALAALAAAGWLEPQALCVAERPAAAAALDLPPDFEALDRRRYGKAEFTVLRYAPGATAG